MSLSPAPLLQMTGISRSYPGVLALDRVDFDLQAGEVHALMGENGAGKSTLIKILSGATQATSGEIRIRGDLVRIDSPQRARQLGISTIYQELMLAPTLSAAENVYLGKEPRGAFPVVVDGRRMVQQAQELLDRLSSDIDARTPVERLTTAQQQIVEIARALSIRASILVMDEPTASLSDRETEKLFEVVRSLAHDGMGVVFISHRMDEVYALCDRLTVLRDGRRTGGGTTQAIDREALIRLMVGRDVEWEAAVDDRTPGETVLQIHGLCHRHVRDVSLEVRSGEVVGLAGLVGAGRSEVAQAAFGAEIPRSGTVRLHGQHVRLRRPADGIAAGIGYVPEDRKRQGIIPALPVRANITLASLRSLCRWGFIQATQERAVASRQIAALGVRTAGMEQEIQTLSGGNQLKAILARWLLCDPKVIILDEPTRGIDVAAKAEVHQLIRQLASKGAAVLVISSEMPELMALADRVVVMHEGRVTGTLSRAEATQEAILRLAMAE